MSEDLPAFGKPIRPTSATVFSSSTRSRRSPGSPLSAKPGALRRGDARAALPSPPRPPRAATNRVPAPTRSASSSPSAVLTTVPSGTCRTRSVPCAPFLLEPAPCLPLPARRTGLRWKSSRVEAPRPTSRITSPPWPPFPPSGPPSGLNFSRWMEAHPFPPLPASARKVAWSANSAMAHLCSPLRDRQDETHPPHHATISRRDSWQHQPQGRTGYSAVSAASRTLTQRRPRRVPNSTVPLTSANSVSSSPRPTPAPGWKCVPRCRTMISPAFTRWPPNRLTPSRWAAESRPFLLDDAPFLCAISALLRALGLGLALAPGARSGAALADTGDLHLRVALTVPEPAPVTGLVLVADHVDLRSAGVADNLCGDLIPAEFFRVTYHVAAVDDEQGGQREGGANLTGKAVHGEDVIHRRLLLPAAAAHDRVHRNSLSVMCGPAAILTTADGRRLPAQAQPPPRSSLHAGIARPGRAELTGYQILALPDSRPPSRPTRRSRPAGKAPAIEDRRASTHEPGIDSGGMLGRKRGVPALTWGHPAHHARAELFQRPALRLFQPVMESTQRRQITLTRQPILIVWNRVVLIAGGRLSAATGERTAAGADPNEMG